MIKWLTRLYCSLALIWAFGPKIAVAQSITPAADGTGTAVNSAGADAEQYDITGGTRSGDNLFHSFEQLGLDVNQIANFLSDPAIENILGRVVGGDPSVIDGLLQVTGGDSNLFLMNPAGIVFGPNMQLNIPADFTATTANGIQLGDAWFSALGSNNYADLVESPDGFAFTTDQSGAILNSGALAVEPGQTVQLIGGTVVNTGTITTPGGEIVIEAVPEAGIVTITQEGNLLSLGVPIDTQSEVGGDAEPLTALALPELLSRADGDFARDLATQVVVEEGAVRLVGSDVAVPTEVGSAIASGTLDTANAQGIGGQIDVLGDRVALVDAMLDASGSAGGGSVRVGGDYQGNGIVPNAAQTYVSDDSTVTVDAVDRGDAGQAIIWADDSTRFYGHASARGGNEFGNGGFVEISGKENLTFAGSTDLSATHGSGGTLLLDPNTLTIIDEDAGAGTLDNEFTVNDGELDEDENDGNNTISIGQLESFDGDTIVLEASDGITIENIIDNSLDLKLTTGSSIEFRANSDSDDNDIGDFLMDPSDTIRTQGGSVNISGVNLALGTINTLGSDNTEGGDITLEAQSEIVGQDLILMGGVLDVNFDFFEGVVKAGQDILFTGEEINTAKLGASRDIILEANRIDVDDLRAVRDIKIRGNVNGTPADVINAADLIAGRDINLVGNDITPESSTSGRNFLIEGSNIDLVGNNNARRQAVRLRAGNDFTIDADEQLTVRTNRGEDDSGNDFSGASIGLIARSELKLVSGGPLSLSPDEKFGPVQLQSRGNIRLEAIGPLSILDNNDSSENFFWTQANGPIDIQGQSIVLDTLDNRNSWFRSQGDINLSSSGSITTNARFATGGSFSINGSTFNQQSEIPVGFTGINLDEIISSTRDISLNGYEGEALKIETTGSVTVNGDINITGLNTSLLEGIEDVPVLTFDPDVALLSTGSTVILNAGVTALRNPRSEPQLAGAVLTFSEEATAGSISVGDISAIGGGDRVSNGPAILSASEDIQTGFIRTDQAPDFLGESVILNGKNIVIDYIRAGSANVEFGGDIDISASGFFRAVGFFNEKDVETDGLPDLNEGDLSFDDIKGALALGTTTEQNELPGETIPTSIAATGNSATGIVRIQHSTETFSVGPQIAEGDGNGNLIFTVQEIEGLPNGTRVFLEVDEVGNTSFTPVDDSLTVPEDANITFRNVRFRSVPLNSDLSISANSTLDENASFTVGAITSSQNNNNNVYSIRDLFGISDGTTTAGPIRIISDFSSPPPQPEPEPITDDPRPDVDKDSELNKPEDDNNVCDPADVGEAPTAEGSTAQDNATESGEAPSTEGGGNPCVVEGSSEILQIDLEDTPEQR
ncbi:MAG: filamentous hemagglutinin N-terminal domain-containing protein [Cyanobacteria bacterium P01_A01_bin.116]